MASGIYTSMLRDALTGALDLDSDTVKVMLVTGTYAENFATHDKRDDITNEVTGTGYTAGGNTVSMTGSVTIDTATSPDSVLITLPGTTWPTSTITAQGAVYYKSRGGVASADELIAFVDFGSDVISTAGTFTLNASTYRISLPGGQG